VDEDDHEDDSLDEPGDEFDALARPNAEGDRCHGIAQETEGEPYLWLDPEGRERCPRNGGGPDDDNEPVTRSRRSGRRKDKNLRRSANQKEDEDGQQHESTVRTRGSLCAGAVARLLR
jgi:hypothetical protein